jgi:hypothetical protein
VYTVYRAIHLPSLLFVTEPSPLPRFLLTSFSFRHL